MITLFINLVLGLLIFGYTLYIFIRFFKKVKKGKCSSCEINQHCASSSKEK